MEWCERCCVVMELNIHLSQGSHTLKQIKLTVGVTDQWDDACQPSSNLPTSLSLSLSLPYSLSYTPSQVTSSSFTGHTPTPCVLKSTIFPFSSAFISSFSLQNYLANMITVVLANEPRSTGWGVIGSLVTQKVELTYLAVN